MAHAKDMYHAQIENAKGLNFLVVRDKRNGKFLRRVTEDGEIALNSETEIVEIWAKDPSVQAFTDLMNRALDKPKEQEQEFKLTGDAELFKRLDAGRLRNAGRS